MVAVVGNLIAISGLISTISVYMMIKYRLINIFGAFCAGAYADDDSIAPLITKGRFIKYYLVAFFIGVGSIILVSIGICFLVYKEKRNRPGGPAIQGTKP